MCDLFGTREQIAITANALDFVVNKLCDRRRELEIRLLDINTGDDVLESDYYSGLFKDAIEAISFRRAISSTNEFASCTSKLCDDICLAINDTIHYYRRLIEYLGQLRPGLNYTAQECEHHIARIEKYIEQLTEYKNEIKKCRSDLSVFKNHEKIFSIVEGADNKYSFYDAIVEFATKVREEINNDINMLDASKANIANLLV